MFALNLKLNEPHDLKSHSNITSKPSLYKCVFISSNNLSVLDIFLTSQTCCSKFNGFAAIFFGPALSVPTMIVISLRFDRRSYLSSALKGRVKISKELHIAGVQNNIRINIKDLTVIYRGNGIQCLVSYLLRKPFDCSY